MDRVRYGDRHDDYRQARIGGAEHGADPPGEADRTVQNEYEDDEARDGAPYRAQQGGRDDGNDQEHDRRQLTQILLRGVGEGPVHHDIAGQVVANLRMVGSRFVERCTEIIGDLDDRRIGVFRQNESDDQPADPPVAGHQAAGKLARGQRDRLDTRQPCVVQIPRVFDKRADDQVVAVRFAMGVVGERVDPAGIGRFPPRFGQLLDRAERLAGEHRALLRRYGDQRGVGCGECRLQRVERLELGVVCLEQAAIVVRDPDESGAPRHRQHEQRGQHEDRPSIAQNEGGVAFG